MNLPTVLDLIIDRETTARRHADRLREQITAPTGELARLDGELADLATTRTTLRTLAAAEFTADDPTIASGPYQQILTVLGTAPAGMRAKGICLALGVEPSPKHVEGTPCVPQQLTDPATRKRPLTSTDRASHRRSGVSLGVRVLAGQNG
ncbi:hypothetical protein [Micromonospora aurantiaca (nom. illeg.)]|uniref:hypothetical protein n=1 Tax=Micromonospora aurantiaca (nom. illeg.) TaxID=47850 RepID=UPI0037A62E35